MLKISDLFQNPTSTLYKGGGGGGGRQEYFSNDANGTPFEQSVPRLMAIVVVPMVTGEHLRLRAHSKACCKALKTNYHSAQCAMF